MPPKLARRSKIWILTLAFLTAVLAVAFALLPRGIARAAVSDIVCALLMLSVLMGYQFERYIEQTADARVLDTSSHWVGTLAD